MKNDKHRCQWVKEGNLLFQKYHDEEWGVPVHDDKVHFEFFILESAQAGLSWETILKRREGYRKAFANFDVSMVASYDGRKIDELLNNIEIIRNRLKVEAAVNNARCFLKVQEEFGSFDAYIWQFVGGKSIQNHWKSGKEIPALSEEAKSLSSDLKKRGFKFVGPTIIYAHMQATGLVNDHIVQCFRYPEIQKLIY